MGYSLGQIIFYSMITLIVLFSAVIILILALTFSGSLSEVRSSDTIPIANLGDNIILSCYLNIDSERVKQVSVTWEKKGLKGLVYQFNDGAPDLQDQNSEFRGRTQLFPDALVTGNASLLLRTVRSSDEGEYTCSISTSDGGGKVNIDLKTAAFTAPTFTLSKGILAAQASRWLPKPRVTWSDYDGNVLNGSTNFTQNSAGIFSVVSELSPVSSSSSYTCRIENALVTSVSRATVTGSGVSGQTDFIFSAASSLLTSADPTAGVVLLCIYYLT
ncbi:V-set domain-containing T-cell activation inhibitor 1 [Pempheris klunzingeri]|uniref:V-set domain-containing T-cell activation inhibitor 1 n=1 Tax=Pempheris klunzingeri TaxID=3127111 RepID=UPI0039807EE8